MHTDWNNVCRPSSRVSIWTHQWKKNTYNNNNSVRCISTQGTFVMNCVSYANMVLPLCKSENCLFVLGSQNPLLICDGKHSLKKKKKLTRVNPKAHLRACCHASASRISAASTDASITTVDWVRPDTEASRASSDTKQTNTWVKCFANFQGASMCPPPTHRPVYFNPRQLVVGTSSFDFHLSTYFSQHSKWLRCTDLSARRREKQLLCPASSCNVFTPGLKCCKVCVCVRACVYSQPTAIRGNIRKTSTWSKGFWTGRCFVLRSSVQR